MELSYLDLEVSAVLAADFALALATAATYAATAAALHAAFNRERMSLVKKDPKFSTTVSA